MITALIEGMNSVAKKRDDAHRMEMSYFNTPKERLYELRADRLDRVVILYQQAIIAEFSK